MRLYWVCCSCAAEFEGMVCPQCGLPISLGSPPGMATRNGLATPDPPVDRDADTAQRYEDAVGREIAVVGRILIALLACLTVATLILSLCWSPYYAPAAALCAFGLGFSIPRKEPCLKPSNT